MKLKTILLSTALLIVVGCNSDSKGKTDSENEENNQSAPINVTEALSTPRSTLTQELKDSITYMYNEEKLAREIYLNLNEKQPLKQLYNIATKSEIKHEKAVNDLAVKYDLNITLYPDTQEPYDKKSIESYGSGEFSVVAIQELYDMLYDKGIQSEKDALEVGCMVEVIDVNDLNKYIKQAKDSNALDVITIFDFLRKGSYNHYWAFDNGLKKNDVVDGCCSLGKEYCHPEYPQDEEENKDNKHE